MTDEKKSTPNQELNRKLSLLYKRRSAKLEELAKASSFAPRDPNTEILSYARSLSIFLELKQTNENFGDLQSKIELCSSYIGTIAQIEKIYSHGEMSVTRKIEIISELTESMNGGLSKNISEEADRSGILEQVNACFVAGVNILENNFEELDKTIKESRFLLQDDKAVGLSSLLNSINTEREQEHKLQPLPPSCLTLQKADFSGKQLIDVSEREKPNLDSDGLLRSKKFETLYLGKNNSLVLEKYVLNVPQQLAIAAFVHEFSAGLVNLKHASSPRLGNSMESDLINGGLYSYLTQFLINQVANEIKQVGGNIFDKDTTNFSQDFIKKLKPLLEITKGPKTAWDNIKSSTLKNKLKRLKNLERNLSNKKPNLNRNGVFEDYTKLLAEIEADKIYAASKLENQANHLNEQEEKNSSSSSHKKNLPKELLGKLDLKTNESKAEPLHVFLVDYDGCMASVSTEDRKKLEANPKLDISEEILAFHISEEKNGHGLIAYMKQFVGEKRLAFGTNRQHREGERMNMTHDAERCSSALHSITALHKKLIKIPGLEELQLETLLMGDFVDNLPSGKTLKAALKEKDLSDYIGYKLQVTKGEIPDDSLEKYSFNLYVDQNLVLQCKLKNHRGEIVRPPLNNFIRNKGKVEQLRSAIAQKNIRQGRDYAEFPVNYEQERLISKLTGKRFFKTDDSPRMSFIDNSQLDKVALLYKQIHRAASSRRNENDPVVVHFMDDVPEILNGLHKFFSENKALIPKNVTLRLIRYMPNPSSDRGRLYPNLSEEYLPVIVGAEEGRVNRDYMATLQKMEEDYGDAYEKARNTAEILAINPGKMLLKLHDEAIERSQNYPATEEEAQQIKESWRLLDNAYRSRLGSLKKLAAEAGYKESDESFEALCQFLDEHEEYEFFGLYKNVKTKIEEINNLYVEFQAKAQKINFKKSKPSKKCKAIRSLTTNISSKVGEIGEVMSPFTKSLEGKVKRARLESVDKHFQTSLRILSDSNSNMDGINEGVLNTGLLEYSAPVSPDESKEQKFTKCGLEKLLAVCGENRTQEEKISYPAEINNDQNGKALLEANGTYFRLDNRLLTMHSTITAELTNFQKIIIGSLVFEYGSFLAGTAALKMQENRERRNALPPEPYMTESQEAEAASLSREFLKHGMLRQVNRDHDFLEVQGTINEIIKSGIPIFQGNSLEFNPQFVKVFREKIIKENPEAISRMGSIVDGPGKIAGDEKVTSTPQQQSNLGLSASPVVTPSDEKIGSQKFQKEVEQKAVASAFSLFGPAIKLLDNDPHHLDTVLEKSNLFHFKEEGKEHQKIGLSAFLETVGPADKLEFKDPDNGPVLINEKVSNFRIFRLGLDLSIFSNLKTPLTIPQQLTIAAFLYEFSGAMAMTQEFFLVLSDDDREKDRAAAEKRSYTPARYPYLVHFLVNHALQESGGAIFSGDTINFNEEFVEKLKPLLKVAQSPKKVWNKIEMREREQELGIFRNRLLDSSSEDFANTKKEYTKKTAEKEAAQIFVASKTSKKEAEQKREPMEEAQHEEKSIGSPVISEADQKKQGEQQKRLDDLYKDRNIHLKKLASASLFREKEPSESVLKYANALLVFLREKEESQDNSVSDIKGKIESCRALIQTIARIETIYDLQLKSISDRISIIEQLLPEMKQSESVCLEAENNAPLISADAFFESAKKILENDEKQLDATLQESTFLSKWDEKIALSPLLDFARDEKVNPTDFKLGEADAGGKRSIIVDGVEEKQFKISRLDENNTLVLREHKELNLFQQLTLGAFVFEAGRALAQYEGFRWQQISGANADMDENSEALIEKRRLTAAHHAYIVQHLINHVARAVDGKIFEEGTHRFNPDFVQRLNPLLEMAKASPGEEWPKKMWGVKIAKARRKELERLGRAQDLEISDRDNAVDIEQIKKPYTEKAAEIKANCLIALALKVNKQAKDGPVQLVSPKPSNVVAPPVQDYPQAAGQIFLTESPPPFLALVSEEKQESSPKQWRNEIGKIFLFSIAMLFFAGAMTMLLFSTFIPLFPVTFFLSAKIIGAALFSLVGVIGVQLLPWGDGQKFKGLLFFGAIATLTVVGLMLFPPAAILVAAPEFASLIVSFTWETAGILATIFLGPVVLNAPFFLWNLRFSERGLTQEQRLNVVDVNLPTEGSLGGATPNTLSVVPPSIVLSGSAPHETVQENKNGDLGLSVAPVTFRSDDQGILSVLVKDPSLLPTRSQDSVRKLLEEADAQDLALERKLQPSEEGGRSAGSSSVTPENNFQSLEGQGTGRGALPVIPENAPITGNDLGKSNEESHFGQ